MKLSEASKVENCKCEAVKLTEIPRILKDSVKMDSIMKDNNGIGLAAPQVGILKKFFIMKDFSSDGFQLMINPEIVKYSDKIGSFREGCLTYKGLSVVVRRSKSIKATWMTGTGEVVHKKLTGRESQVFQHELDHLSGIVIKIKEETV
jgi:peptide deformylase